MDMDAKVSQMWFVETLIDMLFVIEGGMMTMEEPVPKGVAESLVNALAAFGSLCLPRIYERLVETNYLNSSGHIVDVLTAVNDPSSIQYLITIHRYSSYITALAAVLGLKKFAEEIAYQYLAYLLVEASLGNARHVIHSVSELIVACDAMYEWGTAQALDTLLKCVDLSYGYGMPQAALDNIVKFPDGVARLRALAVSEPTVAAYLIEHPEL